MTYRWETGTPTITRQPATQLQGAYRWEQQTQPNEAQPTATATVTQPIQLRIAGPIPRTTLGATKTTPLAPGFEYPQGVPTIELTPDKDLALVLGESLKRLPIQLGATILQAVQGINGPSVVDRDWADRYIADANTDINRFVEEIRWQYPGANALQEVSRLSQNLAYSLTSMGTGTLAALPLWLTPEFTGATKAAAAVITGTISGIVAYRMTTYQIVQQYLEFKDAEKRQQTGQGLTLEEEKQLKTDFNSKAVRYGLWEAVPEGVGNMLFSGILTGAFTNALVKVVGQTAAKQIATSMGATIATKATSIYGEELLTEMITQKGQSDIEVEAGLREGRISWWQALKEIAPQTFLLTTLMAGAGQTVISSTNAIKKAKTSLKNEIGEEHSLYTIISDGIESEFGQVMASAEWTTTTGETRMPGYVQQDILSQAETWLQQVPEVKPSFLHVIGISEGEAFVRTDSKGNPLIAGTSLMRDGQLTLSTIVSAQPNTLTSARALIDVGNYIKENNIAFPPREEMSPDAIRIYDKLQGKVPEYAPTTAMGEWGTTTGEITPVTPEVTPEVTGGIVPPIGVPPTPIPPVTPPITPPTGKPTYGKRNDIIKQSQTVVERDRPKRFTNILDRIPGIRAILRFERPGLLMKGENEKVLVSHVANSAATNYIATEAFPTRIRVIGALKEAFGEDIGVKGKKVIEGGKTKIKFLGTPQQAKSTLTNTLLDIAQNPDLYDLTAKQKAVLAELQTRNTDLLELVKNEFGVEIGEFPVKQGGAFLSNVDISEDMVETVSDEMKAIASGRAKTRFWATARDRMASDKSFKPELNINKLLYGMDRAKANMAAGETFRTVLAGKTRLEVMAETHPDLYKKMMAFRKRLESLRGSAGRLDVKLDKALADFLASPADSLDVADVQSALDVKLARGPRIGMGIEDIQKEIDGVRAQIKALRPSWDAANLKPYIFIQEGIYRYFPLEQANLIRELMKRSTNPFLNFIENMRGMIFSGDVSPILGVQTPVGILADPIGSLVQMAGGIKKAIESGNPLVSFTLGGLTKDIEANPAEWSQFFSLVGRVPGGTPQEFAGGYLSKLPGFSKFTEATFMIVTRQMYNSYRKTWWSLVKGGMSELDAKVAAINIATEVFPLMSSEKMGQSPARAKLLGALPTSYSFIRKPAELMSNATKGFAKAVTRQKLSTEEVLSIKIMITMGVTAMLVSALSQGLNAKRRKEDVEQAILDAINPDPTNGKFLSIMVGNTRIPIGGPYRGLFRAIFPQKVRGSDIPIPFGGLPNYFWNRINPFMRTQLDLVKNKDYYGQTILTGELPEYLLRLLRYEFEGALPLTAGTAVEAWRKNIPKDEMITQLIGQFAGVNMITSKWYEVQALREKYAKSDYNLQYSELNKAQKDELLRNHNDLNSINEEATREISLRGGDVDRVIEVLETLGIGQRNADLEKTAQALLDGDITKYEYDKERTRIRAYYSGWSSATWQAQTMLDPYQADQIEEYVNNNSKPEDKALSEYWDEYTRLIEMAELPLDWDTINDKMAVFISRYPATVQAYILVNKDAWILDLPDVARLVEQTRLSGIEDETWWDDYRGEGGGEYRWEGGGATAPSGTTKYRWEQ